MSFVSLASSSCTAPASEDIYRKELDGLGLCSQASVRLPSLILSGEVITMCEAVLWTIQLEVEYPGSHLEWRLGDGYCSRCNGKEDGFGMSRGITTFPSDHVTIRFIGATGFLWFHSSHAGAASGFSQP